MPCDPPAHGRDSFPANLHIRGLEDLHVGTVDDSNQHQGQQSAAGTSDRGRPPALLDAKPQSLSSTGRLAGDRITGLKTSRTPPSEMLSM